MDFIHEITQKDGTLYLTHAIEIKGGLRFLFSWLIGKKIIVGLPEAMHQLSKIAEKVEL